MSQRQRVSIIVFGLIIGTIMGLVLKDTNNWLITGVAVSSVITIFLTQQSNKKIVSKITIAIL